MKQNDNIFRTIKDYESGFFRTIKYPEARTAYQKKSEELKAKILLDINSAPELILAAEKEMETSFLRRQFTKYPSNVKQGSIEMDIDTAIEVAEKKAIEIIKWCLIDSKPLRRRDE